ncbi:MAG: hypothetical protein Q9221_009111 [Calogaya cf. arnoldii]
MVVIIPFGPLIPPLNAYSTVPLTTTINETIRHGFWNGTYARFGDPQVTVTVHDRADFHGKSHYDIRNILDAEGKKDVFLIADERTVELQAIWFVETTAYGQDMDEFEKEDPDYYPSIHYPDEDFTLWQGHFRIANLPYNAFDFISGGAFDLSWVLGESYYYPYDPHDPQDEIISWTGITWDDPKGMLSFWGPANLTAISGSEVEWSTDEDLRKKHRKTSGPLWPTVARLTAEAAREGGVKQQWYSQERIVPPGEEVTLTADYDPDNPKWPDFSDVSGVNALKIRTTSAAQARASRGRWYATRSRVLQDACRRGGLNRPRPNTKDIKQGRRPALAPDIWTKICHGTGPRLRSTS